jgi:hypothetical protein
VESYNFLSDLLDTFQSSSEFIKALIIVTPPAFILGLIALLRSGGSDQQAQLGFQDDLGSAGQMAGPTLSELPGSDIYPALVEHQSASTTPRHCETSC